MHFKSEEIRRYWQKIHSARSRNDQVLVDIKPSSKNEILEIKDLVKNLFQTFTKLSNKHQDKLIPGLYAFSNCNAFLFWTVVLELMQKRYRRFRKCFWRLKNHQ